MTLIGLLLGCWAVMLIAPETPAARLLHRVLVSAPCRLMAKVTRGQVMLTVMMLAGISLTIGLLGNDGRMLVTMGLPETMAFATAIDLTALIDLAAVAMLTAGTVRLRSVRHWIAVRIARPMPRARRPRSRGARPPRPSANDDDRPAFAHAA